MKKGMTALIIGVVAVFCILIAGIIFKYKKEKFVSSWAAKDSYKLGPKTNLPGTKSFADQPYTCPGMGYGWGNMDVDYTQLEY